MNEDPKHEAELRKWQRKLARIEDDYENATKNLKGYLKAAFGKGVSQTRLNLAKEVVNAERTNPARETHGEGFKKDNEVITGFDEYPWTRDVE